MTRSHLVVWVALWTIGLGLAYAVGAFIWPGSVWETLGGAALGLGFGTAVSLLQDWLHRRRTP